MSKGKLLSLVAAGLYVLVAVIAYREGKLAGKTPVAVLGILLGLVWVLLALACIWFGDEIGAYKGKLPRLHRIDVTSPGCMVRLVGWLFLLIAFAFLVGTILTQ
jgi:hypothetical protein